MDLIKVPKVVYHEAGATSLIYNAKNDILFVVLSDQTGVVVVCENLPTGQQMSRLEYKYNSPTDFINGIQIYGTYPFKVMRHSLEFGPTDKCLVLRVPSKIVQARFARLWHKDSEVGRKIVAISRFREECEIVDI